MSEKQEREKPQFQPPQDDQPQDPPQGNAARIDQILGIVSPEAAGVTERITNPQLVDGIRRGLTCRKVVNGAAKLPLDRVAQVPMAEVYDKSYLVTCIGAPKGKPRPQPLIVDGNPDESEAIRVCCLHRRIEPSKYRFQVTPTEPAKVSA